MEMYHCLIITAEEFILNPKHLYVKEQPHAARVLQNNTIKHKNAQLSYLNRLRPQLLPQTKVTFTENAAEPQQEQLELLPDDEEVKVERDKDEILEEKNDSQAESILGQLQFLEGKKFIRAKTIVEIIKKSEKVTINHDNEVIYVDRIPTGLKAAVFLYDIQQPSKTLHNPVFIIILTALNLNEKLVINRNAKHAFQSRSFNAQEKREPGPSRTRAISHAWQGRSSPNLKRSKKQKRKSLSDNRKTRNQKWEKESEEGSDSYGTPYNDSDSPTSETTKAKTKQWENYQD